MKKDTIVTLGETNKYYLTDETSLDNEKYFIGIKLDELNNPTLESKIFNEISMDGKTFLKEVEEETLLNKLAEIFTDQTNNIINNMEEV